MNNANAENTSQFQEERYRLLMLYSHVMTFDYDVRADLLTYTLQDKDEKKVEYRVEGYLANVEYTNILDTQCLVNYLSEILESENKEIKGECDFIANIGNTGYRWYRAHFINVLDEAGELYHILGCVQDIEEEKEKNKTFQNEIESKDQRTGFYHYEHGKKILEEYLATNPKANSCGMMIIQIEGFEKMASLDGNLVENAVFLNIVDVIRRNNPSTSYFIRSGSMQFMVFDTDLTNKGEEDAAEQIVSEIKAMYIHEPGDLLLDVVVGISRNEIGNNFSKLYHNCQVAIKYARENHLTCATVNRETANMMIELSNTSSEEQLEKEDGSNERYPRYSFPSTISYEIRTPLNAILGMTTLAKEAILDKEEVSAYLDKISVSTKHLITLLNTISDMSEVESGKLCFTLEPFSVEQDMVDFDKINLEIAKQHEVEEINEQQFVGKRILLVEDNKFNIEVEKGILEKKGFLIEVARDGKKAVEMVAESEENYYDVILMDIRMPVMDGNEATQKIRMLPRKDIQFIPIFAVSANAFHEEIKQSLEAGMDAYITKPVNTDQLFTLLQQHLK